MYVSKIDTYSIDEISKNRVKYKYTNTRDHILFVARFRCSYKGNRACHYETSPTTAQKANQILLPPIFNKDRRSARLKLL